MHVALSGWFWNRPDTGSGQYLRHLLQSLLHLRPEADFTLIAPPAHVAATEALPGVHYLPVQTLSGPLGKVMWEQVALPRAARRVGADLLHVPYWASPVAPMVPTVVTVHDLIPLLLTPYRGGPGMRLYTALVAGATSRADLILTDSESSRFDIMDYLRVPPERVISVPLAVEAEYTAEPAAEDSEVLARLGLAPGYVLYLGGFDARKNLEAMFGAFALAHQALGEEARLVVAGRLPAQDTAFTPHPQRLFQEVGLSEAAVRFVGFVPEHEKPALYRAARAFIFPSRYEGFGLPPLEALACGVPVVGSHAASLPEVVGAAGVLTDPEDIAGMAGALIQLLIDESFYIRLRRCALEQAAHFSWQATAERTWDAYRRVVLCMEDLVG